MTAKYFALLTNVGVAKLANATALGNQLAITAMAVGDANGTDPAPTPTQTTLIHECHRAQLNSLRVDPSNPSQVIAEQVLAETVGGWWIREIGLYDTDGDLIAIGNCPPSYKPLMTEGSGREQIIRMLLIVSSSDAVELKIDPSVVLATREYVDDAIEAHAKSRNHPDASTSAKGLAQLSSATNSTSEALAATPKAVKAAYDLANGKLSSVPDATTTAKGVVQLNSATNSTSETQAATPKAVKAAYDLANGKLSSVPDASTTVKGVVQLNSATNNTSETQAATPKAVKAAYDLANGKLSSVPDATTAAKGIVQLNSATNSTSEALAATPKAVKATYDLAATALPKSGGTMTGEIKSTSANAVRMIQGGYGVILRMDGNGFYILQTNKDDSNGNYNANRSVTIANDTGAVTVGTTFTVNNTDFIRKDGVNTYVDSGITYHQTNGVTLQGVGDQYVQSYALETVGQRFALRWRIHSGGVDGWPEFRNDGSLYLAGNWPAIQNSAGTTWHSDGNIQGACWGGDYLSNYIRNAIQNIGQLSVSGNQWWVKINVNGGTLIVQGGYTEVRDAEVTDRIPLNIAVPNRLLHVAITNRNFAQGYATYNPQVTVLYEDNTGFNFVHGQKERMIYWMAVGY
ncbi:tail fiber protein [Serratia fonticola]|uniref:tail fiber protein n=1 Tax=Serratia fonticola TaxID=47917 RepID=UPI001646AD05|nr:tail fiber protein [Serratia fonticola]MBC3250978.1 tail fiber protein [Serratia fonticola]